MNTKTARLIRKATAKLGTGAYRRAKHLWLNLPHTKRHESRLFMQAKLAEPSK